MVFSSAVFLLVFLPIVVALYYLMPNRGTKNTLLFVVSLVFYAWGEPVYIALMLVSILVNWLFGLALSRGAQKTKRSLLLANIIVNLGILGFFKYEGFFADNINALVGSVIVPNLDLPLPIGISFYTLQAMTYIIDVYRGQVEPQKNPIYLGMYIAMFPQLVAGPIVRYSTIQEQILNRKETLEGFCQGLRLFIVGLAKKVLLANIVAILATQMLGSSPSDIGTIGAWAGLIAFSFQIFFDFSGYSDMAIGLGKIFGFQYLRNFNYPYISKSATEFWRRWHISLSSFFRDYVYIPLGGSRVSTKRWIVNIAIVWGLTGFWHGAAWNYILWGVFYGALLVAEKTFLLRFIQRLPSFLQHVYGILCFLTGWLIFWIEDLSHMGQYALALFGAFGLTGTQTAWEIGAWQYLPVFLICIIASTPVVPWVRAQLVGWANGKRPKGFLQNDLPYYKCLETDSLCVLDKGISQHASKYRITVLQIVGLMADVLLIALLVMSVASVVSGSFNPFIYFRF